MPRLYLCCLLAVATASAFSQSDQRSFADEFVPSMWSGEGLKNDCSSATGISMAFSLIYPGASGQTLAELRDTLRFPQSNDKLVWGPTQTALTSAYDGRCEALTFMGDKYEPHKGPCTCDTCQKTPTIKIANSVWIDKKYKLQSNYSLLVGDLLFQIDFGHKDAGSRVNKWVKNSTQGLIDSILPDKKISGAMVALNAIYLNATWKEEFKVVCASVCAYWVFALECLC